MNRAFLEAYNKELSLLYERAAEFSDDYPGIAERLGGLLEDNMDPAVAGLLEGTAFMAARVQLKLQQEFRTFTEEYLEQIAPGMTAPTPSAMLVRALPPYQNKSLAEGLRFEAGSYMDAAYRDRDRSVSARYRLSAPLELWPLKISDAAYIDGPASFQALGLEVIEGMKAGLKLDFFRPDPAKVEEPSEAPVSEIEADVLPIHFVGSMTESVALYEQLLSHLGRITLRYLNAQGDPVFVPVPLSILDQIGFGEDERFVPEDTRTFRGFALLREAFIFPRKFLGIRLTGLKDLLPRVPASSFELLFEFEEIKSNLAPRVGKEHFALFCAPAVNLFEENCSNVKLNKLRHEFIVVPDSSPSSHYEIHRLLEVFAQYQNAASKVKANPLYGVPTDVAQPREALYYTYRRKPRRLTAEERRFDEFQNYRGTETFLSFYEPGGLDDDDRVQRLQVRALCSNRHLAEYLPLGQGGADFALNDDVTIDLECVAGPTKPREAVAEIEKDAGHRMTAGDNYWRLISHLSLNHLGIDGRGAKDSAAPLKELLSLFADLSDAVSERQLQGIEELSSRPVVRQIKREGAYHPARGIEITVTFDERAFEGSGILLWGAVLDRFFADYAAVNSFTQTVIASEQRGKIKTFPPRSGSGPLL